MQHGHRQQCITQRLRSGGRRQRIAQHAHREWPDAGADQILRLPGSIASALGLVALAATPATAQQIVEKSDRIPHSDSPIVDPATRKDRSLPMQFAKGKGLTGTQLRGQMQDTEIQDSLVGLLLWTRMSAPRQFGPQRCPAACGRLPALTRFDRAAAEQTIAAVRARRAAMERRAAGHRDRSAGCPRLCKNSARNDVSATTTS